MKKKHTARSAFAKLRILLGLLIFFTGVFVALFARPNPQAMVHEGAKVSQQEHPARPASYAPASSVYTAWVARYNGPSNWIDQAYAIATDGTGNVYITGASGQVGIGLDYATVKYNSAGQEQWVAHYNGPGGGDDFAQAIAVDSSGNVYVTGKSPGPGSAEDYATIKYNSAGQQQWVARYNGPGNYTDIANAIAVDLAGNVYVTGTSDSGGQGANYDYATIKYNSAGQQQWVARYDGPANDGDHAYAIAVDSSSNVYVTGASLGSSGQFDYATIKYNSAGQQQWVARYSHGWAAAIALDISGNVYVTGSSAPSASASDYATVKYDSTGQQQWAAVYNGPGNGNDEAYAIALDSAANVYVTGRSLGSGTSSDYATIKYNSAGQRQWVARYDGPEHSSDEAHAIAVDRSGNVYVTGQTYSAETLNDYMTIKYSSEGQQQWMMRYDGPSFSWEFASAIAVDGSGNVYVTGESYAAETHYDYATIKYVQSPVTINPSKDNTLYQYVPADGDRSNALGDHLFAGETALGLLRRGVLAFDVAGSVPVGSTITSANLTMHMSRTDLDTARSVELHKLLADWGEGTSHATGEEGEGAPATANDATWRHRFYDTIFWTTQGGDFSNTVSASQPVGAVGDYTWNSAQMTADVQLWLDNGSSNFGWLVLGDESTSTTAKRFDTRESDSPPVLTIEYTPPPTPTSTPTATPTPLQCSGELITILDENFDKVTPPALPPGWTATNAIDPDGILWQTSNSGSPSPPADSPPNATWVNDPAAISDKYLDSPSVNATDSFFVQLTFRHNFNLESGLDGGVLEISNFGEPFQDILAAGGSFVAGGYNTKIAPGTGSPIAGRPAWSGNSGGFITTIVTIPQQLNNAVFRWRMASDNSGGSEGWRVDTVNAVSCHALPGTPTPHETVTPTSTPTPSASVTPTPTVSETASPTPRPRPTPRLRPTPADRP